MILWLLLFLVFPVTAWGAIPNVVGQWTELPGTSPESVCQFPEPSTHSGVIDCAGLTRVWNGAVMDTLRNRMCLGWGGGHNDYFGTEIICLAIGATSAITDDQTMTRVRNSPANPQSYGNAGLLSGNTEPRAVHTYANLAYIPSVDKIILAGGGSSPVGDIVHGTQLWAPGTNVYQILSPVPALCDVNWYSHALAYDGDRDVVWGFDGCEFKMFTVATETWSTPSQPGYGGDAGYQNAQGVYDPVRKRYYLVGGGALAYMSTESSTSKAGVVPSTTGCGSAFPDELAANYDPVLDRIVTWHGGNTFWLLNTTTHVCTSVSYAGGPTLEVNGIWGRMQYSRKDNLYVVCHIAAQNCQAIRLSLQSADSDFAEVCNAPGVTRCQTFDMLIDGSGGGVGYYGGDPNGTFDSASIDTSFKVSGTGSLKFTLPAGRATSDIAGSWLDCLRTGCGSGLSSGFTQGQTFYIQYQVAINDRMMLNLPTWRTGVDTGWKVAVIHGTDGAGSGVSCDNIEITSTIYPFSNDGSLVGYTECGNRGMYGTTTAGTTQSNSGPYIQTTANPGTSGFSCDFNAQTPGLGTGSGCFVWTPWYLEFLVFNWEITIVNFTTNSGTAKLWVSRHGSN